MMNIGLLEPYDIIEKTIKYGKKHKIEMNNIEGLIMQAQLQTITQIHQQGGPEPHDYALISKTLNELAIQRVQPGFHYVCQSSD